MRVTELKAKHSGKCSPSQSEHITGQKNETIQSKKKKSSQLSLNIFSQLIQFCRSQLINEDTNIITAAISELTQPRPETSMKCSFLRTDDIE